MIKIVLAVQLAERKALPQDRYDAAYSEWEVKRATLGSELRGHFKDPQLAVDWAAFSETVTKLYILSGTYSEPYRNNVIYFVRHLQ